MQPKRASNLRVPERHSALWATCTEGIAKSPRKKTKISSVGLFYIFIKQMLGCSRGQILK